MVQLILPDHLPRSTFAMHNPSSVDGLGVLVVATDAEEAEQVWLHVPRLGVRR